VPAGLVLGSAGAVNSARAFPRERCTVEVARGTGRRKRMEQGFHVGGAPGAVAVAGGGGGVGGGGELADLFSATRAGGFRVPLYVPVTLTATIMEPGGEGLNWLLLASTGSGAFQLALASVWDDMERSGVRSGCVWRDCYLS